jgi:hypothetical protein
LLVGVCADAESVRTIKQPKARVCEECVKIGPPSVHLRRCQTCGVRLCCDLSPNRHATKHALGAQASSDRFRGAGEYWLYCYSHDAFAEYQRQRVGT